MSDQLTNPTEYARTRSIVCPSGLSGIVRAFKTKEANILANEAEMRRNASFDKVLAACWLETTGQGVYQIPESGKVPWEEVLVADRFYAMCQIRIATYGAPYIFNLQCPQPGCRERFQWEIDLESDLACRPLPEESKANFQNGNRFEASLPGSDKKVVFRLLTGKGEQRAAQHAKQQRDKLMTVAMAARIAEIEGVHENDKIRFLDELDMGTVGELIDQLDSVDGGIDTKIEVECEYCSSRYDIELPFGREFYLPIRRALRRGSVRQDKG